MDYIGRHRPTSSFILAPLLSIPAIVAFCWAYVRVEHPVYVWDFGAYWHFFQNYGKMIAANTPGWFESIQHSIRESDYNPLSVVLLYPFYVVFGDSRTVYIAAVSLFYLLPTACIATLVAAESRLVGRRALWLLFVLALSYLPFWRPTLRGMVDIAGLVPLGAATLLVFRTDFLRRRSWSAALALGVLLYAPFLLRRWYAFAIVAFLAMLFVCGMIARLRAGQPLWKAFVSLVAPMTLAGCVSLILLALLQYDLVARVIGTSYGDLYAGYQIDFALHFVYIPIRFGWYFLLLMALGAILALFKRDLVILFCLGAAVLTFFLFIRVQQLGFHHLLPIAFWVFPAYAAGASWLGRRLPLLPERLRLLPFSALALLIFVLTVFPGFQRSNGIVAFFVPEDQIEPLHLQNYPEYRRLVADLMAKPDIGERVTVFASSLALSDWLLQEIEPGLVPHVSPAAHVPSTDFFRFDNLRSRYVVVADPPQTQLAPGFQDQIVFPSEMILKGDGFGVAYSRVNGPYSLADGATAYIYRRDRTVTAFEMKSFVDRLDKSYPGWAEKFRLSPDILFAAREIDKGPDPATVVAIGPQKLLIHSGDSQPTRVSFPVDATTAARPRSLNLAMNADLLKACPDADGVNASVRFDGSELWSGVVQPGQSHDITLPAANGVLDIAIDKRANLSCDHVIATLAFPE